MSLTRVLPVLLASLLGCGWLSPPRGDEVSEFPTTASGAKLALVLTGNDRLTADVRDLAERLARMGTPAIQIARGWGATSPESAGASAAQLARDHLARWHRERVLLIGLGDGAGITPFVANRLDTELLARVDAIVLYGLAPRASFRSRWNARLTGKAHPTDPPVLPELERLRGVPIVCLYDRGDVGSFCPSLEAGLIHSEVATEPSREETLGAVVAERVLQFAR